MVFDAGAICAAYQNEKLRNLTSRRIQVDAIWSFTYANHKNVKMAKAAPEGAGDTGVTDKLWEKSDIVALIEAKEANKPTTRGPYRKREA